MPVGELAPARSERRLEPTLRGGRSGGHWARHALDEVQDPIPSVGAGVLPLVIGAVEEGVWGVWIDVDLVVYGRAAEPLGKLVDPVLRDRRIASAEQSQHGRFRFRSEVDRRGDLPTQPRWVQAAVEADRPGQAELAVGGG